MGKALANCRALKLLTGAMPLPISHTGKDEAKGVRGWSGIYAAADVVIEIKREGELRSVHVSKQKDADDGASWGFQLVVCAIGVNEKGNVENSCTVEYSDVKKGVEKKGVWEVVIEETFD
jgi:hypothetical protein